jgi:hypothetical protein
MSTDRCPICTEPQRVTTRPGVYECQYCKAQIINGQLICPACKRANDINLEYCSFCNEPLTVVGAVMSRQAVGYGSRRLEQLKEQAAEIKAQAEMQSHARMSIFNDVDQRRIQSEREAAEQQKLHDQKIFKYTALGLGAFLLLVAIISLIVLL